jgi:hypothetical protein
MTSKNLKSAIWLVLAVSATALAAPGGGGGGGGGNKPPTEAGFNLSVPAIITGSSKFVLNCPADAWSTLTVPSKAPVWYDAACATSQDGAQVCVDEGYYFVQRDAVWQAPCRTLASITNAIGAWGDNLGGDAKLKVGSPIRVELVVKDGSGESTGQLGYKVIKLEPAELDRVSDYGHLADDNGSAVPTDVGSIVHDPGATLKIVNSSNGSVAFEGVAGGEINATGKIVYGYNLRVTAAGTYRITYTLPNVAFGGCEAGDPATAICAGHEASVDIVVGSGGGGGGGKGKPTK